MAKKVTCSTTDCEGKVTCCGMCGACYQWSAYHNKAGVAANVAYRKRQKRVAARIEQHMPERKLAKSVHRPARGQYAGRTSYMN